MFPSSLQQNSDVFETMTRYTPDALSVPIDHYLPSPLAQSIGVLAEIMRQDGSLYAKISEEARNEPTIFQAALQQNLSVIGYVPMEIRERQDFQEWLKRELGRWGSVSETQLAHIIAAFYAVNARQFLEGWLFTANPAAWKYARIPSRERETGFARYVNEMRINNPKLAKAFHPQPVANHLYPRDSRLVIGPFSRTLDTEEYFEHVAKSSFSKYFQIATYYLSNKLIILAKEQPPQQYTGAIQVRIVYYDPGSYLEVDSQSVSSGRMNELDECKLRTSASAKYVMCYLLDELLHLGELEMTSIIYVVTSDIHPPDHFSDLGLEPRPDARQRNSTIMETTVASLFSAKGERPTKRRKV